MYKEFWDSFKFRFKLETAEGTEDGEGLGYACTSQEFEDWMVANFGERAHPTENPNGRWQSFSFDYAILDLHFRNKEDAALAKLTWQDKEA